MIGIDNLFTSIDEKSKLVFKQKEFALIGVSPFNSYFTTENIILIIKTVLEHFDDFAVFIPNEISKYNLEAIGYTKQKAACKVRKQDNYLKNKVSKAIQSFDKSYKDKIILLSDLSKNSKYVDFYLFCMNQFNHDEEFRIGCLDTSKWVLESYAKEKKIAASDCHINIAVRYFLEELPIFLGTSEILNINSCSFIYHSVADFLVKLYSKYDHLISNGQGFTIIKQFFDDDNEKITHN